MNRPARPGPTKRRRRREARRVSHERWLVSYADFITLLFAFFTTMYAISTVDARKLGAVVDSMQAAFANGDVPAPTRRGGGPGGGGASDLARARDRRRQAATSSGAGDAARCPVGHRRRRLSEQLAEQIRDGTVEVLSDPRGLVVSLREAGASRPAAPTCRSRRTPCSARWPRRSPTSANFVRVEGHTDDVPIHTDALSLELGALDGARDQRRGVPASRAGLSPDAAVGGRLRGVPPARAERRRGQPRDEPPRRHRHPQRADDQPRGTRPAAGM